MEPRLKTSCWVGFRYATAIGDWNLVTLETGTGGFFLASSSCWSGRLLILGKSSVAMRAQPFSEPIWE